jgi:hypothetical protein
MNTQKGTLHSSTKFYPRVVNKTDISFTDEELLLLLQSALQPLVGLRPAQLSLSILSRKVFQSAVASGKSNPQLGGEPVI